MLFVKSFNASRIIMLVMLVMSSFLFVSKGFAAEETGNENWDTVIETPNNPPPPANNPPPKATTADEDFFNNQTASDDAYLKNKKTPGRTSSCCCRYHYCQIYRFTNTT